MRIALTAFVLGLLGCAQTNVRSEPRAGDEAPPARDSDAAQVLDASDEPAAPCSAETRPGDACDPALGDTCPIAHCGVSRALECIEGAWTLQPLSWQSESSPFDFTCAPEDQPTTSFCTNTVQCCGQTPEVTNGCPIEGGCELCPAEEPVDGTPCALPPACDDHPGPRVIDCYYKCCCYGTATWAQCDGDRWHLNTQCTPL